MQQVHHTRAGAVHNLLQGFCLIRLVIGQPVLVGKAPEQRLVPQLLYLRQRPLAKVAGREAEIPHGIVKILLDIVVQLHQVLLRFLHRKPGVIGVLPAVVAYHMPLIYHPLYQLRLRLGKIAGDEEDGLDPLLLQGIQYLPGKAELIPLVKGQVHLVAVLLEEDGIILAVGLIVQQRALAAVFLVLRAAGAPVLARVILILGIAMGIILLRLGGAGVVGIILIVGGLAAAQQHGPAIASAKSCFFMVFSSIFRIIRLFYTICKTPAPLSACIVTHFAA